MDLKVRNQMVTIWLLSMGRCRDSEKWPKHFNFLIFTFFVFYFIFGDTGAWIQGLHFETLHQPFFCERLFWERISRTICLGWLQPMILLISASGVAGITGVSHWCLAWAWSFKCVVELALQIFYWEFLCLCSSRSIIFFFCPCLVGAALVLVLC
jgi:hypothetical protein